MAECDSTVAEVSETLNTLYLTSLRYNAKVNNISQIEKLLSQGVHVDEINKFKNTALIVAAIKNVDESHFELAELLLKKGADVNAKNCTGQTPLWYLVRFGSLRFVELFLNYKADVTVVDSQNRNLLYSIVLLKQVKDVRVVQLLLDRGLDVNDRRNPDWTPLHLAAYSNADESHFAVSEVLLKNGADVNARNFRGETPLHLVVKNGNLKIVRLFLSYKADVNAVDDKGNTPLFSIIHWKNKNVEVMQLLLDHGGKVNHRRIDGKTALNCACESHFYNFKFIKCLLKNGACVIPDGKSRSGVPMITVARKLILRSRLDSETNKKIWCSMVKYTDFSVMHSHVSILTVDGEPLPDWMMKIIIEHIAKLLAQDWTVQPALLSTISSKKEYNNYLTKCKNELLHAKKTKLKDSWLTFYNLLVDDRKKFKNYGGNEKLVEDFEKILCKKKFPIYGGAMVMNLRKGIERRKFYDRSSILLSNCLPIFNPNHLIIRDTLDCLLSKKNLLTFCK